AGGRFLDPQRADHRGGQLRLVPVPAPEAGHGGARGGRHRFQRHAGVAEFTELAARGGQDRPVQGRVSRPPGFRLHVAHYILIGHRNVIAEGRNPMTESLPASAFVRVSRATFDPSRFADVDAMNMKTSEYLIPAVRRQPGLIHFYSGVSPEGSIVQVSVW